MISLFCLDRLTHSQERSEASGGIARRIANILPEIGKRIESYVTPEELLAALGKTQETALVVLVLDDVEDFVQRNGSFFAEIESRARAALLVFVSARPNAEALQQAFEQVLRAGANAALLLDCPDAEAREAIQRQIRCLRAIEQEIERATREVALKISMALPHEFRTPLNGLIGFISLLRQGVLTDGDKQTAYEFLESSVHRLHQTAEKFLLYAELERLDFSGNKENSAFTPRRFATYGFCSLCAEVASETAHLFDRVADLRVTTSADEGAALLRAQHARFIVAELITNACKFSTRGAVIECAALCADDAYTVSVRDGGWGMSEEEIRSIGVFNQFGREEREQQGMGFGLAIVGKIASLYGGSLRIESASSAPEGARGGTTVTVVVPAAPISQTDEGYAAVEYITMHPVA